MAQGTDGSSLFRLDRRAVGEAKFFPSFLVLLELGHIGRGLDDAIAGGRLIGSLLLQNCRQSRQDVAQRLSACSEDLVVLKGEAW